MSRIKKTNQVIRLDRLQELCMDYDNCAKGYGYNSFKNEVGLSHSSLGKVLYNNADFSAEALVKISKTTGVSIDWLLGVSDQKYLGGNNNG